MSFDDSPLSSAPYVPKGGRSLSEDWQLIANFLLNEDPKVFRLACKQINTELYDKLTALSKKLKMKETMKRGNTETQSFKREHWAPSELEEIKQSAIAKVKNLAMNLVREK